MIHVSNLTKRYGSTVALNSLTLTVPEGSVFGLVGPNGSGKSTLFRLLMGFIFPDAGHIDRGSLAPTQIGYSPDRPFLPARFRIGEYLMMLGQLSGLRGDGLRQTTALRLQQVGLSDDARVRIGTCSKGMLQRLSLAAALIGDPPLLLLDEPMGGLDPSWQMAIRDLIKSLHGEGKTVLLSTHRLADVAEICTHLCILKQGQIVRAGPLGQVLMMRPTVMITVDRIPPELAAALGAMHPDIAPNGNVLTLSGDALSFKREVLRRLVEAGVDIQSLRQQSLSLEEVYREAVQSS